MLTRAVKVPASSPSASASTAASRSVVRRVTSPSPTCPNTSASTSSTIASFGGSVSSSCVSAVTSASGTSPLESLPLEIPHLILNGRLSPCASTSVCASSSGMTSLTSDRGSGSASSSSVSTVTSASGASPLESLPPELLNLILDALVLARCHSPATDGCCRNACLGRRTPWAPCPAPHGPLAQPQCGVRELKSLLLASKALSAAVRGLPSFQALLLSVSVARGSRGGGGLRGGQPTSGPTPPFSRRQTLESKASQQNTTAITGTTVTPGTAATTVGTLCVSLLEELHRVPPVSGEDTRQWVRSLYLRELTETPGHFGTIPKISGIFGASNRHPRQELPPSTPNSPLCHCTDAQVTGRHCTERQGTGTPLHRPSLRCAGRGEACWGHHGTAFTGTECHCTERANTQCHSTDRANTECPCTDRANTERQCTEGTSTGCGFTERIKCTECVCPAEVQACSGCGHWLCPELQQYSAVVVLHLPHWFNDRLSHALGGLRSLRVLCLRGCAVGDATLAELATAGGLRELDLASTGVSSAGIFHLEKLEFLKILNLSFCRGICPQSGVPLQRLRALEELYLCGTVVSDDTMGFICSLPRLRRVDLEGCEGVSDAGLDVIGRVLTRNRTKKESLCQRSQWGRGFMEVSYLE